MQESNFENVKDIPKWTEWLWDGLFKLSMKNIAEGTGQLGDSLFQLLHTG